MFRPAWIEIDLGALRTNFKRIRRFVGSKVKIIATIKQSAYGHGLIPVATQLHRLGVDFFGVGGLDEAIKLREERLKEPILVLSPTSSNFAKYFVEYDVRPTVVSMDFARALNREAAKRNVRFPVHIKIDTGMGRLGLYYKDAYRFIKEVSRLKSLSLEGIFTHFPAADIDPEFTNHQISVFNAFVSKLKGQGIRFLYQHCANSMGVLKYRHCHFNMVRPGLILYGIRPQPHIPLKVEPMLSLKSKIIFLKKIQKGRSVSYARTYIARRPTLIGTVAIGYADGYPWSLSGRKTLRGISQAKVIVQDSFFNVVGRVCMDHIMIDLKRRTDIGVGQEVILIGKKKGLEVTASDLAKWAHTISYEIVSRLSFRIPRIYNK
ncbi:MAG: alanine racemase [Candidatus Omnitrophota bacterium]|nr:MAG: alanine racemase [Candidatus Omnitrophota bacterium]